MSPTTIAAMLVSEVDKEALAISMEFEGEMYVFL
jgi:hypothetical protein